MRVPGRLWRGCLSVPCGASCAAVYLSGMDTDKIDGQDDGLFMQTANFGCRAFGVIIAVAIVLLFTVVIWLSFTR